MFWDWFNHWGFWDLPLEQQSLEVAETYTKDTTNDPDW